MPLCAAMTKLDHYETNELNAVPLQTAAPHLSHDRYLCRRSVSKMLSWRNLESCQDELQVRTTALARDESGLLR